MSIEKQQNTTPQKASRRFPHGLNGVQIFKLVIMSWLLWLAGAVSVKLGGPLGFFGPETSGVLFLVTLPFSWVTVIGMAWLARLETDQIVPAVGLGLAVATFCDGIALTWASWLYGHEAAQILPGAAWILWGAFTFLSTAFAEAYRRQSRAS